MIQRDGGAIAFACDECPETYEATTENFNEAWQEVKAHGWRSFKIGTEWCHACPDCVKAFGDRQR